MRIPTAEPVFGDSYVSPNSAGMQTLAAIVR